MPKILELKEIDGNIWVMIGTPGNFLSGVALWTPDEQKQVAENERYKCAEIAEKYGDTEIANAIRAR